MRRRAGRGVHVEVEIASFYPAIAFRIARWFYANTQSRIHVLVTHGFLRSLARLELEESAVGRFVERPADAGGRRRTRRAPVTVGDTPWAVLAGARRAWSSLVVARARRAPPLGSRTRLVSARSFARSWRDWMRRTVPDRERMTSDSVGRAAVAVVVDALEHVAVRDARGREEHVLARHEVVVGEDAARDRGRPRAPAGARRRRAPTGARSARRRCT